MRQEQRRKKGAKKMRKFKKRAIVAENRVRYLKQKLEKADEEIQGLREVHLLESAIIGQLIDELGEIVIDSARINDSLGMLVKTEIDGKKIIVRKI